MGHRLKRSSSVLSPRPGKRVLGGTLGERCKRSQSFFCIAPMMIEGTLDSGRSCGDAEICQNMSAASVILNLRSSDSELRFLTLRGVKAKMDGHLYRAAMGEMDRLLSDTGKPDLLCEMCDVVRGYAQHLVGGGEEVIALTPKLAPFLDHLSAEVRLQAVLALGSIALISNPAREALIAHGVPASLAKCSLDTASPPKLLRHSVRTLSYIASSDSALPDSVVGILLPLLRQLLHHPNEEILTYVCVIFFYLTDLVNGRLQEVIDSGVVPRLAELLESFNANIARYTLYTLYNLVSGTPTQARAVLDCDILPSIQKLLYRPVLQKDAVDMVSNILFSNHVQKVLDSGIIQAVLDLSDSLDAEKRMQALLALRNLAVASSPEQILQAVNLGVLKRFCAMLLASDTHVQRLALEAIKAFFEAARDKAPMLYRLVKCHGALVRIHALAKRRGVKDLARTILERYFNSVFTSGSVSPHISWETISE